MGYDGENLYLGIDEPEPVIVGKCAYCREDIYEGTECFCCNGVLVHTECFGDYVQDEYSESELAGALGFEQKTAQGGNMKVYKGTDRQMKCRGMQYTLGETAVFDGEPHLCRAGLHACEQPIDVLNHYTPNESRYFEAEAEEVSAERESSDSKIVAKKMTLKAEIGVPGLVKAQIEYVKNQIGFEDAIKRANAEKENHATGDQGAASATGNRGAASATGNRGAASATGYRGAASATGDQGAASATSNLGAASATGNQGAASATGYRGAASATGNRGAASATGYQGAASATGDQGAASATGYQGAASATGKAGVALAAGYECKAMGALGCAICCVERGEWDGETYPIIAVKAAIVDGEKIKADTWYCLKNGEFVEVE